MCECELHDDRNKYAGACDSYAPKCVVSSPSLPQMTRACILVVFHIRDAGHIENAFARSLFAERIVLWNEMTVCTRRWFWYFALSLSSQFMFVYAVWEIRSAAKSEHEKIKILMRRTLDSRASIQAFRLFGGNCIRSATNANTFTWMILMESIHCMGLIEITSAASSLARQKRNRFVSVFLSWNLSCGERRYSRRSCFRWKWRQRRRQ